MTRSITETKNEASTEYSVDPGFNEIHLFCNICMGPDDNGVYMALCGYKRSDPNWVPAARVTCTVCADPAMRHTVGEHGH